VTAQLHVMAYKQVRSTLTLFVGHRLLCYRARGGCHLELEQCPLPDALHSTWTMWV